MSQGVRDGEPGHVVHTMQVEESVLAIYGLSELSERKRTK